MYGHTPWRDIHDPKPGGRPGWAATIECAGDPDGADEHFVDQLEALVDALLSVGGAVSGGYDPHDRYAATFSVYTDSNAVTQVVDEAIAIFLTAVRAADLPPWPIVKCEVMTFAEQDAEMGEPSPN